MKILLVHNRYQQYGGEDATFELERDILLSRHHEVETLVFENKDIDGSLDKLKTAAQLFYNFNSASSLEEMIDRFDPDIIHVHNFFYLASPSIFYLAKKKRKPIVVTIQNYRLICSGSFLMRDSTLCELCVNKVFPLAGIKHACHQNSRVNTAHLTLVTGIHKLAGTWQNKIDKYITVTEFGRNKLINSSLKLRPDQVLVKSSSVPQIEEGDYTMREDFFVFVGRLSPEKGVKTIIEAFRKTNFKLEIIGDGPLRGEVEKAVAENPNIIFSGYQSKKYIAERLRKSLALVFGSMWYECLPVVILEAFSTGTPVIISDIGNLNEIVSDRINGLHFKAGDANALGLVLNDFVKNKELYRPLYANARNTYVEKYMPEINYSNLIKIYREVIESNKNSKHGFDHADQ